MFYNSVVFEGANIVMKVQRARRLHEKELSVLYRISQLTGVLLEEELVSYCATDGLARVPLSDQREVEWTRRALHE